MTRHARDTASVVAELCTVHIFMKENTKLGLINCENGTGKKRISGISRRDLTELVRQEDLNYVKSSYGDSF